MVELALQVRGFERLKRQGNELRNPAVQKSISRFYGLRLLGFWCGKRIFKTPMTGQGRAGPDGAIFVCGLIADGDHQIKGLRLSRKNRAQGLAAQVRGLQSLSTQMGENIRIRRFARMSPGGGRDKSTLPQVVQQRLRRDRARRIGCTEKQHT